MPKDPVCLMDVSEKSGIKITYAGNDYFFCSGHCKDRFLKEHDIDKTQLLSPQKRQPIFKNKIFILFSISFFLIVLSFLFEQLVPFRNVFFSYLKAIWWALALGLFLGGLIDYYVPREYISKILSKKSPITIINAVFLGFLMSACSHGILALSIQLHKKGASNPAVVSFLLASPWANMAVTFMLVSLFGLKGLFIIAAAIIVALNTGFIFMFLEKKGLIEKNKNTVEVAESFSIKGDFARRAKEYRFSAETLKADFSGVLNGSLALSNMVLSWIILGMLIASFAGAYIPAHFFHRFVGPSLSGLLVTLALATIIEVCSEGSSPLAFEIYRQTGALGNSFTFLMAGVATDYTEIGLLWANVGRRTALWFPLVAVPQIIAIGYLANIIFR
ncbi:MAG: permease [Candidatus Omnitrophota bacterium]|nr:permease [Candidatus Omnitrophota bacterium]